MLQLGSHLPLSWYKMLRINCILVASFQVVVASSSDGLFPLRMPEINPTKNEAYLCTGVEIGSSGR